MMIHKKSWIALWEKLLSCWCACYALVGTSLPGPTKREARMSIKSLSCVLRALTKPENKKAGAAGKCANFPAGHTCCYISPGVKLPSPIGWKRTWTPRRSSKNSSRNTSFISYQMWAHGGSWPPRPTVAPDRRKLWCICLSRPGAAGWGSTRCTCCPCCERWAPRARRPSPPSLQSCAAAPGNTLYSHLMKEKGKEDTNQSAPTAAALKIHALAVQGWSASKTKRLIASWIRQRSLPWLFTPIYSDLSFCLEYPFQNKTPHHSMTGRNTV